MLRFLPGPIKGVLALAFIIANTLFWSIGIYGFAILKLLVPIRSFRAGCTRRMVAIGERWIALNSFAMRVFHRIEWNVEGLSSLSPDKSYLVTANHQSWVDIVVLQHVLNRRIPFLRFFLKRELIYVPFLGLVWWALDFPFMRRYSKEFLLKHPEYRGRDLETTRRACETFRGQPTSILNFLEGTRRTPEKMEKSQSPYRHLLAPKTGGVAFVLQTMGSQFDAVLDVTIQYPEGRPSMWSLMSGKISIVRVRLKRIDIPSDLLAGRYLEEDSFRGKIQDWVRDIWIAKDEVLNQLESTTDARPLH